MRRHQFQLNGLKECYIRPIVFLGDGEMGVAARHNPVRVSIAVWPWGAYLGEEGVKRGVRLKTSSFIRFHHNSLMPHAKATGHYINSVLAVREAQRGGYDEAMLLDVDGFVAEGSGENLFVIRDGVVTTPPSTSSLAGITRASVISILRDLKSEVIEQRFPRDLVYIADEVFMTGTAAEVTPVREVDDRRVGNGTPGPVTRKVQEVFAAALRGREPRYKEWLYPILSQNALCGPSPRHPSGADPWQSRHHRLILQTRRTHRARRGGNSTGSRPRVSRASCAWCSRRRACLSSASTST